MCETKMRGERSKQYLRLLSSVLMKEDIGLQIQVVEVFRVAFEYVKTSDVENDIANDLMNEFFLPCFEHYTKMELND